jgi:hypothetical protein
MITFDAYLLQRHSSSQSVHPACDSHIQDLAFMIHSSCSLQVADVKEIGKIPFTLAHHGCRFRNLSQSGNRPPQSHHQSRAGVLSPHPFDFHGPELPRRVVSRTHLLNKVKWHGLVIVLEAIDSQHRIMGILTLISLTVLVWILSSNS